MEWLEIGIDAPDGDTEALCTLLDSLGVEGLVIEDEQDIRRFLEESDTFGIFHLTEVSVEDFVEFVENAFVDPLVEEIHLIWAVIKDVFDAVLDAGFDAFHIVIEIGESKLWLNHPEFAGVTGGVGFLGTEGWTKGVNVFEGHREGFDVKLSGNSQGSTTAIEVVDWVFCVSGDGEDGACTFSIVTGDFWGVDINEASFLEEGMDGHGKHASNPEDSVEGVGSWTKVSFFTKELKGGLLLLKWIIWGDIA